MFKKLWGGVKKLASLPQQFLRLPAWQREIVIVLAVAAALGAANYYWRLDRYLVGPDPWRDVWLGLVFLAAYLTMRFFWSLLRKLSQGGIDYPDIRQAFARGRQAADAADVDLANAPIFLVLGGEPQALEALAASPLTGDKLKVESPDSPLQWRGDRNAVWLVLWGVSAVAAQTQRAQERGAPAGARLSEEDRRGLRSRLQFTIKQLQRMRNPLVPANGVQLLVPYAWIADPNWIEMLDAIQLDMETLQSELGVKCILQILFYDNREDSEFSAYIERTPEKDRQRRCGCTLPSFAKLSEEDREKLHHWMEQFFTKQVYAYYGVEPRAPQNPGMFRFVEEFRRADMGFQVALGGVSTATEAEAFYPSGVYLTRLQTPNPAFLDGVMDSLLRSHDEMIGWNSTAANRNRRFTIYSGIAAAAALSLLGYNMFALGRMLFVS